MYTLSLVLEVVTSQLTPINACWFLAKFSVNISPAFYSLFSFHLACVSSLYTLIYKDTPDPLFENNNNYSPTITITSILIIVIAISCIYNHILTPKLIMMHTLVYTMLCMIITTHTGLQGYMYMIYHHIIIMQHTTSSTLILIRIWPPQRARWSMRTQSSDVVPVVDSQTPCFNSFG